MKRCGWYFHRLMIFAFSSLDPQKIGMQLIKLSKENAKLIFSIFSQSCSYTVPISSLIWPLAKPSPGDWESIKDLGSSNKYRSCLKILEASMPNKEAAI